MKFSENFTQALQDYIFFLEKKYPEKSVHELVSTRYALNHFERSVLYRGVTTKEKAGNRGKKLITSEQLANRTIHIDLFNVLFTIAAYLRGFPVYEAMDSLVRDASEGHDSHDWVRHLEKALDLVMDNIDGLKVNRIYCYLDTPIRLSSYVANEIEKKALILVTEVSVIRDGSPDHLIRSAEDGILATSDSSIIDHSLLPVFDLPKHILSIVYHFSFVRMADLIAKSAD